MAHKPPTDEELAHMRDGLPRIWFAMYQGSIDAGFSEYQALELVKQFILASFGRNEE